MIGKKNQTKQGNVQGPEFNPFPGLRPFSIDESHLFFGREGQSEEVLKKLSEKRFIAVIGASGSGKSSLIYCGLVPIMYGGFITDAGSRWKIVTTRPGNDPISNLAESLVNFQPEKKEDPDVQFSLTRAVLHRSSMGLVECIKQLKCPPDENILLIVDQFEELFRFKASREDHLSFNESEAFVKLLVEAVDQKDSPIYIVLTMRSDFIGDCSQFQDLTELINNSNYLIPQMTRDDFREAIEGPVAVGGATIEKSLVQQLLNEVGDDPDQLPILQHALMRTWDYWKQLNDPEKPIALSDYEAVGKMEKALSEHANEAFDELDSSGKRVCESIFKTLTEKGADNRGIRHPTRVEVLAAIAKSSSEEVIGVVDRFRASGRSFLAPASHIPLQKDSVIDLSHESLMRIWNNLKIWVEEESQAIQMYSRLSEASAMYQEGKTGLWRPPDLQLALNWRNKQQPTLTWAERYNPAFERSMVYLETSEKEYIAEEENKVRMQKRALRRTRITALVMGAAAILSLGFMLYAFIQQKEAERQRLIADENWQTSEENRKQAEENLDLAEERRVEAENNFNLAEERRVEADSAKNVAEEQTEVALSEWQRAENQTKLAEDNYQTAVANQLLAEENEKQAEAARDTAYNLRLLSIAQSMSVKSLQIDQDLDLKGLLAYQAFLFNEQYGGVSYNADIYSGLYDALKAKNKESYRVFRGHQENAKVNSIAFLPGSNVFYSASDDGQIFEWDLDARETEKMPIFETGTVIDALAISPDGNWLACGTLSKGIQLFNLNSRSAQPVSLAGHTGKVKALAFFPDNRTLISTGPDKQVFLWDVDSRSNTRMGNLDNFVQSLDVSPDGNYIAGATREGKILLWNRSNINDPQIVYEEDNNAVYVVRFNDDGSVLATGDYLGNVKLWDYTGGTLIQNLRGHTARISGIRFSPDGSQLGTASTDGKIQVWEMEDLNSQPIVFGDNEGYVMTLAFSSDGSNLVAGTTKGDRLIARPTRTNYMIGNFCNLLSRNLTPAEWNTYIGGDIEYKETCRNPNIEVGSNNE